jgi:aminoglycoside phosphotransferase family enzyme/predicted kinase
MREEIIIACESGITSFAQDPMNEAIIECLSHRGCYPGNPPEVSIIQTHLSVVCLAGENVYKLKKPIQLPFVDFSTRERREHFCREEVRLNRRLCPDVYRDVVPLYETASGWTFMAEEGAEVADYAVLMRRLPQGRMMDELLREDAVEEAEVRGVAAVMARFHDGAERGPEVLEAGDPERLQGYALDNFSETAGMVGDVFEGTLHEALGERTRKDFSRILPVLRERMMEGRVVDGHGDLHARNICLCDPVAIYDCIEFNAGFRCGDVATDNSFMVMDLIYRGHRKLAEAYLDAYVAESGDEGQREVMPALVRYRAMVRAKVAGIAAGEHELSKENREEARGSARRHLNLMAASAIEEDGAAWVIACGLPATGKSHVFGKLAAETGWPCLASDRVRKELAGAAPEERLAEEYYSPEFSRRTYAELFARARVLSAKGPVLLDANFPSADLRAEAKEMAAAGGVPLRVVFFEAPDEVIERRLAAREEGSGGVSDADRSVYAKLKGGFERPSDEEGVRVLRADGAAAGAETAETVARVLTGLLTDNG